MIFTSHYVSINSKMTVNEKIFEVNLHPTMYLLIPEYVDFYSTYNFIYIPLCIY